jgi:carbon monoxide dehydrogenase subunit G
VSFFRQSWAVARRVAGTVLSAGVLLAHAGSTARSAESINVIATLRSGIYEVRGEFTTAAPLATAWEVLTDYAGISAFVASIHQSTVERRGGDSLRVRQIASVGVFPFRRTARVTLVVSEEPKRRIEFMDVLGEDFRKYTGSWALRADSGSTVVSYALDAVPRAGAPGWLGRSVMSHTTADLLAQVRREIERRAAKH